MSGPDESSRPEVLSFDQVSALNTGHESPLSAWLERQGRSENLALQSRLIADRLEAEGIRARDKRPDLVIVGHVTGCVDEAETYRPIYILPVVAQRERHGMLQAFELFRKEHPQGSYFRFAVVTFGPRIPLRGSLRSSIQKLQRRISRWSSDASARYGLRVVLRATEFTIDAAKTFHVHCNIIFFPRKRLSEGVWDECLKWSRGFFGAHWHDSGLLKEPREVVKYVTKPADVLRLSGPELAWLYAETRRCKLVQPMGEFRQFRSDLERRGQRVVTVRGSKGVHLTRMKRLKRSGAKPTLGDLPMENLPVARLLPNARFANRSEPCTIFQNFTTKPTTYGGRLRLRAFERACAEADGLWHEKETGQLRQDAPDDPEDPPL